MIKKNAVLFYDLGKERFSILSSRDGSVRELHCGDCFRILKNRHWYNCRIEMDSDSNDWYLELESGVRMDLNDSILCPCKEILQ